MEGTSNSEELTLVHTHAMSPLKRAAINVTISVPILLSAIPKVVMV
jgi:hypothetical protein